MDMQQLAAALTLERVAEEGLEVTFADVEGYCTPLGQRIPIQACHHPHIVMVHPDMAVSLGVDSGARGLGFAVGTPLNLPEYRQVTRRLHRGYLPIVESDWETDGLRVTQTAFCVLPTDDQVLTGQETQYVLLRYAVTNAEHTSRHVPCFFYLGDMGESHHENYASYKSPLFRWESPPRDLTLENSTLHSEDHVILAYQTAARVTFIPQQDNECGEREDIPRTMTNILRFDVECLPGETQVIDLVITEHQAALHPRTEDDTMRQMDFATALQRAIAHWELMLAPAMTFITPEPRINNIYKALILFSLAMQVRDPEMGWHEPRQWPISWVWSWEFAHTAVPLQAIGYHRQLEPSFRYFLERQNGVGAHSADTKPQGDVSTATGSFTGFSGEHQFLWMNETGSILWALAAQFLYARDVAWFQSVMPNVLAAWAWVQHEREQTRILDVDGNKVRYYGLLPAGMPGDIHAKYYQFTFNDNITWYGMQQIAFAAQAAGLPEADRFTQEAEEYRQCILDVLHGEEYVEPETGLLLVPNMVFYRETEEPDPFWHCDGPIQLYDTGLLHPLDERFAPMVEYTRQKYGILLGMTEHFGGGTEWYPNQTERSYFRCYLARGEVEKALLVLYSNLVYGMSNDTYQTSERFHTDDENFSAYQPNASANGRNIDMLRRMVIDEQDPGKLWLLRGCPRRWLTTGQSIIIENAPTLFGTMSLRTHVDDNTLTIDIDAPDRDVPEAMILQVRVPQGTVIAEACIDGCSVPVDDERIILPQRTGRFVVTVRYTR